MNSFSINGKRAVIQLYRAWIKLGDMLGWINSRIILGIMFYLLFVPIGLLLRLLGKGRIREMQRNQANTFRQVSTPRSSTHFERLF